MHVRKAAQLLKESQKMHFTLFQAENETER